MSSQIPPLANSQLGSCQVLELIGSGAMGSVFRARHPKYGDVCIKVVATQFQAHGEMLRRFRREAEAAKLLDHPHVVRGFGLEEAGDHQFLIQEFVAGGDLRDYAKECNGKLEIAEGLRIIREVALGLGHAHEKGLVHRDLKPGNVLLCKDRSAKVGDFGLVLQVGGKPLDGKTILTQAGQALGTPYYMAPEQWRSAHEVDHRTDIYAMGAMLHKMLSGKLPIVGKTMSAVMVAHMQTPPTPLRKHRSDCPEAVERLILRMLAKEPADRFGSATEVARAIDTVMDGGSAHHVDRHAATHAYAQTMLTPSPEHPPGTLPTAPMDDTMVGGVIGGKFEILQALGRGGMGVVYRARHKLLGTDYAIKLLLPKFAQDPDFRKRFLREAQALQAFIHEGAVSLREFGEHQGSLYMVLDFIPGETLDAQVERQGALSEERAMDLARQVLPCLQKAHEAGLVHRDLKPQNLMLEPQADGGHRAKILDFGIAKMVQEVANATGKDKDLTGTGVSIGTPHYMAPEQEAGDPVDARTDIYAFACVLYEAVAGHRPLEADTVQKLRFKIQFEPPQPLKEVAPGRVSDHFSLAIHKALAKNREERPPDAMAFLAALEGDAPKAAGSGTLQIASGTRPKRAGATDTADKPATTSPLLILALLCVVVVVGMAGVAGGTLWWFSRDPAGGGSGQGGQLASGSNGEVTSTANAGTGGTGAGITPETQGSDSVASTLAMQLTSPKEAVLVTRSQQVPLAGKLTGAPMPTEVWIANLKIPVRDGRFATELTLLEGRHEIAVLVEVAGMATPLASRTIVVDTTPPKMSLLEPSDGAVLGQRGLTLRGRIEDGLRCWVTCANQTIEVEEDGRFSLALRLPEKTGPHSLTLVARDQAGNESQQTLTLILDQDPPVLRLDSPQANTLVPGSSVRVSGRVEDHSQVTLTINKRPVSVGADGRFSVTVPLPQTRQPTLEFEAEDALGNYLKQSLSLRRDLAPPTLVITEPRSKPRINSARLEIRGEVSDESFPVSILANGEEISVSKAGPFSLTVLLRAEGEIRISVVASDAVGHESDPVEVMVIRDVTPPTVELDNASLVVEDDSAPLTVTGTVSEACREVRVGTRQAPVTGRRFSLSIDAGDGQQTHQLVVVDLAGNSSAPVTFTTERKAPPAPGTVCPQCGTPRKKLQAKFCTICRHRFR